MNWKNEEFKTYPQIIDKALSLEGQDQSDFVEAFAKTGEFALQNIGYFSGYYDREKASKIMEVFKTEHPIFGRKFPSLKEAYQAGKWMGEKARREDERTKEETIP